MTLFDSFKPFNFNEGVPYVSVTNNGVTFNKSVVMKLGYPEYVILLFDEETKRMAIKCSYKEEPNATSFYKKKRTNVISVRWNGKDLLNTIQDITGWDLSKAGYRVDGILIREEQAMLFDLNFAVALK